MPPQDAQFDNWPVENHEGTPRYVGTAGEAGQMVPVYYAEDESTFFAAEYDEENERVERVNDREREWQHEPDESLGEKIEHIGEELGWQSLADFAEEHLEDDEERSR